MTDFLHIRAGLPVLIEQRERGIHSPCEYQHEGKNPIVWSVGHQCRQKVGKAIAHPMFWYPNISVSYRGGGGGRPGISTPSRNFEKSKEQLEIANKVEIKAIL